MAAPGGRFATHVVVCLFASCVVSAADEAGAALATWGVDDQTAVVGLLFELRLAGVNTTSVLRVSWTFCTTRAGAGHPELTDPGVGLTGLKGPHMVVKVLI